MEMENSKSFGKNGSKEKTSNMVFSSAANEENGKKKNDKKKVSSLETKKMGISGSTVVVYNNADYLTYMHHPPKHNWFPKQKQKKKVSKLLVLKVLVFMLNIYI